MTQFRLGLLGLALVLSTGCGPVIGGTVTGISFAVSASGDAETPFMTSAIDRRLDPAPPDAAQVVFLRPSSLEAGTRVHVMDADEGFLGDSLAESYFTSRVSPGAHTFIGWGRNTSVVEANLEAGKTYFVVVDLDWHYGRPLTFQLRSVRPADDRWAERQEWVGELQWLESDRALGTAWLEQNRARVTKVMRQARAKVEHREAGTWALCPPGDEWADKTLCPADGV